MVLKRISSVNCCLPVPQQLYSFLIKCIIDSIKESEKKKKREFVLDTQALLKQKAFDVFIVDGLTHEVLSPDFFTLTSNNFKY